MTRLGLVIIAVLSLASVAACDKPTPESCEKALRNMQQLLGTETLNTTGSLQGEIRRCRGGSSKEAVECATKATTLDELHACHFYATAEHKGSGTGSGSAH